MTQGDRKQINTSSGRNTSFSHMVRQGATAFAVIAGLIAMGAALIDKKTRQRLVKGTQNVLNAVGSAASNMTEQASSQYRAVAHRITRRRSRNKRASSKIASGHNSQQERKQEEE